MICVALELFLACSIRTSPVSVSVSSHTAAPCAPLLALSTRGPLASDAGRYARSDSKSLYRTLL